MKTIFLTAGLVFTCISITFAQSTPTQSSTPRIDKRQDNQQERIEDGRESGALSNKEALKLEAKQAEIQAQKLSSKDGGKTTLSEKAKLSHKQNTAGAGIAIKKNNAKRR